MGLAAFDSPNFPPLATVGARIETARHLWRQPPTARLRVHTAIDGHIVVVRLAPGALATHARGEGEGSGARAVG